MVESMKGTINNRVQGREGGRYVICWCSRYICDAVMGVERMQGAGIVDVNALIDM